MQILRLSSSSFMSFTANYYHKNCNNYSKNTENHDGYCIIDFIGRICTWMSCGAISLRKRIIYILWSLNIFAAGNITGNVWCRIKWCSTTFSTIWAWILVTDWNWRKATIFHLTVVIEINVNILYTNNIAICIDRLNTEKYE
jgi:hypothetical protein